MAPIFDKNIPKDIKVVTALDSLKSESKKTVGCLFTGIFLIGFLGFLMLSYQAPNSVWFWLLVLMLVAFAYLLYENTRKSLADLWLRKNLDSQGNRVQATVIGHEVIEMEDNPNQYIVYYQFRPNFIVKHTDFTKDKKYFNTPLGGQLEVMYLRENPEINGLKF